MISIVIIFSINLIVCTFGRKQLSYKGIQIISTANNFFLLVYCTLYWNYYVIQSGVEFLSIKLNPNTWTNVVYEINFKINCLSFLFIFLVNIIGFSTNIYILNYFKSEEREEEFILLINWFILSMILLVSGNNFFTLILGWELIGLTSFLLINFWKYKITTLGCSFKAFTFNKFSDLCLMVSFCSLWNVFKVDSIDTLLTLIDYNTIYTNNLLLFSCLALLVCSSIKSAQFIGHLWLPDSMEAPVPASSLIHSATLVSAGIYLILKFYLLFVVTNQLAVIFFLGSLTACYGGIVAASQTDVKKILAYSTISHCGFIYTTIALNNFVVTVTYLYLHGFFKAVTFFCVGSLIKYNSTQDTRLMGMLKFQLVNIITLLIASINLGGLPFTFGYLYKQIYLLEVTISNYTPLNYGFIVVGMLSSVVYVYKLVYYSCFDYRKGALLTNILYLQNYKSLFNIFFLNFTYIKVFAFFILYMYAFFFFIILNFYILNSYFFYTQSNFIGTNELMYLTGAVFLKKHIVLIYYKLFGLTVITLILNSWRSNYLYLQKFTIIYHFAIFLVFFNIINLLLKNIIIYIFSYDELCVRIGGLI